MKGLVALLLCLACSLFGHAQNVRTLEWYSTNERTPSLTFVDAAYPAKNGLPVYAETYSPSIEASDYVVRVTFPIYEPLTNEEEFRIKSWLITIPDTLSYVFSVGRERKRPLLDLVVNPFLRKGKNYYKLVSFNWSVQPVQQRASSPLRASRSYAASSVLSSGKWKKMSVASSGMYKLTYEDVVKMGLNPNNVQVYGYGGKMLGEDFRTTTYIDDLPEVAVWKVTGSDGLFNSGDYLLFYAQGPVSWYQSGNTFLRQFNPYSNKAYYFVGERAGGSLIATTYRNTLPPTRTVTTYTHLELHEKDVVNMGESVAGDGSGRELYGEDMMVSPSRSFTFSIPDVDTTQLSTVTIEAAAFNTSTSYGYIKVNEALLSTLSISGVPGGPDNYVYGTSSRRTDPFFPKAASQTVNLELASFGNSPTPRAFLNYIILNVRRFLKSSGKPFTFRDPYSVTAGGVAAFSVQGADASTLVFDVTDPLTMRVMEGDLSGSTFTFSALSSTLREYACVSVSGNIPKPTLEGNVSNQNLHAYQPDMVIITPEAFRTQAQRLAQAHQEKDNLSVLVVTPEEVYNEFSSGTPDATAYRRMMKLYYDKATTSEALPDYLLLFGGGIYDNRRNTAIFKNTAKSNWLLTYQSQESLDGTRSFTSDDYFGFLDDEEGADLTMAKLDVSVGRYPIHSEEQARATVDKTLRYMKNNKPGNWKNRVLFMADDGDYNLHMRQAEGLASTVDNEFPHYMVNRIYVDAYKRVANSTGVNIPDGDKRLSELLDMGLFLLNYTGHSSMTEWAEEKIMTKALAKSMTNVCLPLWITASCDFSRFDTPDESGGELAFLNPIGGAIGLFSTSRIAYAEQNSELNKRFIDYLFKQQDSKQRTLGNIMLQAKNSTGMLGDRNKLSFILVGNPALKLASPSYTATITRVNDRLVSAVIDTFKALQRVTVEGEIKNEEGVLAADFTGVIHPTVLDASTLVKTLGDGANTVMPFYDKSRVLLSSKDSVVNGRFRFTFVVPKDIQYSFQQGRINLYAADNENVYEANGVFDGFALGGTTVVSTEDTLGPSIRLFLNDTTFVSGDAVNQSPTLIARLFDESGLNGSDNGVGHDFQLIIDNDPNLVFSLNGRFIADIGSYRSGTIRFVMPELSGGQHTLSLRAWDVLNNSNTQSIRFDVRKSQSPRLYDLMAVRQPESYRFSFSHNRPDVPIRVRCEVIDLLGRVCWSESVSMQTGETKSEDMVWSLFGSNGVRVPSGIYVCRVWVKDATGGESLITEKIQVLPQ